MGQFYDKIWDEDRVFLFLYSKKYYYDREIGDTEPFNLLPIKVSKIREKIKHFDKYRITNEKFKQNLMDLGYCKKEDPKIDEIYILEGIMNDIQEKINEIYTIFLSVEFFQFLITHPMFPEKRIIVDYIIKDTSDTNTIPSRDKKYQFIEFLVNHFNILADLFLQHTGKMIF